MTDENILIAGKQYKALKILNLTEGAEVQKHTVEDQTEIADHVILAPAAFDIDLELYTWDDEFAALKALKDNRQPFTLISPRGVYEHMLITALGDEWGRSLNTSLTTITVQQVRVVETQTVIIDLPQPVPTEPADQAPGGNTPVTPPEKEIAIDIDPPQQGETWKDKLLIFRPGIEAMKTGVNR